MSSSSKVVYVLLGMFGIVIIPYFGAYFHLDGNFDAHYFDFPPLKVEHEYTEFNWPIFYTVGVLFILTAILYIFPRVFGFKKSENKDSVTPHPATSYPVWFWIGGAVWLGSFVFLLLKCTYPKWFLNWAYVPLYWGFTFMLDGIAYKRTGGKSIFNNNPQELIGIGVASVSGWLIFEFLNMFVQEYWYYPNGDNVPVAEFYTYAIFASSALMPLSFEWYSYFNTFPSFVRMYQNGPRIKFNRAMQYIILAGSCIVLFLMPFYPTWLCAAIWLAPLLILTVILDIIGVWTPFTPIRHGNWTPVLFLALTYLLEGFLLEGQNYLSARHHGLEAVTAYPGYWMYNVPFVNGYHVFEMPVMGFYGYLPFGIYCMVWWIAFAYILNIPTNFTKYENPVY